MCGFRNQSVITLFDKATGKTSVVFEAPAGCMAWCQWDRKGQNAIVAFVKDLGGPQKLEVHLIPVDSQKPGRKYEIEAVECTPGIPLPEVNGNLFIGDVASNLVHRKSMTPSGVKTANSDKRVTQKYLDTHLRMALEGLLDDLNEVVLGIELGFV